MVDLVNIDAAADGADQCQRELATQMLAEFLQSAKQFVRVREGGIAERQSQIAQTSQHPVGIGGRQTLRERRVDGVDRDSDRHRFSMTDAEPGHRFQTMGRPMPEVQRPGFPRLERIAAARDVVQMQLSRTPDHRPRHWHVALADLASDGA